MRPKGCDAYTTDTSSLAAAKSTFDDPLPSAHMAFSEIVSTQPLGLLVRQGDDQWSDIGRWTLNALYTDGGILYSPRFR